jgi:hypothetical protein
MKNALLFAGLALLGSGCSIDDRNPRLAGETDAGNGGSGSTGRAGSGGVGLPSGGGNGVVGEGLSGGPGVLWVDAGTPCPGCLIGAYCVAAGVAEPGNACHVCDPGRDGKGWSSAEGGCDDGAFCTIDDHCEAGVCVGGSAMVCDDAIACNGVSSCDEGADRCTPAENQCSGAQLCDTTSGACVAECPDCQIDGVCVAAGATLAGDPCRVCDPGRSSVGFSPNVTASCGSPASACSAQDTCNAQGLCVPNDFEDGTACGAAGTGLACIGGACSSCGAAALPDEFCATLSPDRPVCDEERGACAACVAASCTGATPVCDVALGCRSCTEHSECPGTACHLSGPSQGRCFAPGEVVQVSTVLQFETQVGILVASAPRVLRLAGSRFDFPENVQIGGDGTEMAIIGQPGTVLSGGTTSGGGRVLISTGFGSTLYVANLTLADGPVTALSSSSDSTLWVDDVSIRGFDPSGLSLAGEAHVRRSSVRATTFGILCQATLCAIENTSIGPGAVTGLATLGSPIMDVRYVTVAGNTTTLDCNASPGPSGFIRNSLLTGTGDPSIAGNACDLLSYPGSVTDQAGFGTAIGHFDASWFRDSPNGDLHLTALGAQNVGNAASRDGDDPALDVDGDARPSPGAPGLDQP